MYECLLCREQFKKLDELEIHIRRKHEIHANSEQVLNHLKAYKIRDEVLDGKKAAPAPKAPEPPKEEPKVVEEVIEEEKLKSKKKKGKKK